MPKTATISKILPALLIPDADQELLRDLATTLVKHNFEQYNTLYVTKDGHPDTRLWVPTRKIEGIRIYRERLNATGETSPSIPSLLLFGSVVGKLDDIMYGVTAPTDEALKIKSSCIRDGVLDSKVLEELEVPDVNEPFHSVTIQWRLYEDRDYVTLDTTGIMETPWGERVGYSVSHSVGFPQFPSFTDLNIVRGNMSVCSLYRQKANNTVECFTRGFFDLSMGTTSNAVLTLQTIATRWLSFSRNMECAQMKKLSWRLRKNIGDSNLASTLVTHNLEQCNTLLVTKGGYLDSSTECWKEMRRKYGLRIYRERPTSSRCSTPFTPSLLLLGTVEGTVEDIICLDDISVSDTLTIAQEELAYDRGNESTDDGHDKQQRANSEDRLKIDGTYPLLIISLVFYVQPNFDSLSHVQDLTPSFLDDKLDGSLVPLKCFNSAKVLEGIWDNCSSESEALGMILEYFR
ncbi:hypothetical protein JM16_009155 [Phytophthora kernoviae]|uniref:Uncharacterized protein n=1 Tax=Phytophthora kernoviae TaxID=325452 RepID=A0A8T0LM03_9STRA|nr:hypothetical protein JM16_009155 [Phytophthora kernoviae]